MTNVRTRYEILRDKFLNWTNKIPLTYYWFRRIKHTAKKSAKNAKVPHNLSTKDVQALFKKHKERCYFCGLHNSESLILLGRRLTLDRLIPKLGYINENVVPACYLCNHLKSNFISVDTMKLIGPLIIRDARRFFYKNLKRPVSMAYSYTRRHGYTTTISTISNGKNS